MLALRSPAARGALRSQSRQLPASSTLAGSSAQAALSSAQSRPISSSSTRHDLLETPSEARLGAPSEPSFEAVSESGPSTASSATQSDTSGSLMRERIQALDLNQERTQQFTIARVFGPVPYRRKTHGHLVAKLHFSAYGFTAGEANLFFFMQFASRAAYAFGIPCSKPISYPTRTSLWTVLKDPFVKKKIQENFQRRTMHQCIELYDANRRVVDRWLEYLYHNQMQEVRMKVELFDRAGVSPSERPLSAMRIGSSTTRAAAAAAAAAAKSTSRESVVGSMRPQVDTEGDVKETSGDSEKDGQENGTQEAQSAPADSQSTALSEATSENKLGASANKVAEAKHGKEPVEAKASMAQTESSAEDGVAEEGAAANTETQTVQPKA